MFTLAVKFKWYWPRQRQKALVTTLDSLQVDKLISLGDGGVHDVAGRAIVIHAGEVRERSFSVLLSPGAWEMSLSILRLP